MNSKLGAVDILGQSRSPLVCKAPRRVKNPQHLDRAPTHSVGHQVSGLGDDPFACAGYSFRATEPRLVCQHRHRCQHSGSTTLTPALSRAREREPSKSPLQPPAQADLPPSPRPSPAGREREPRHHLPRDGRWLFNFPLPDAKAASTPLSLRERARVRVEFPTTPKTGPTGRFFMGGHRQPSGAVVAGLHLAEQLGTALQESLVLR